MDKTQDRILLGIALVLTGAVVAFAALDSPPLAAPAAVYVPAMTSAPAELNYYSDVEEEIEVPGISSKGKSSVKSLLSSQSSKQHSSQKPKSDPSKAAASAEIRINLNTAGLEEIMQLTTLKIGIGKATAERIFEYRETNGEFLSVEDLLKISGIGESKYQKLLPYVFVE